MSNVSISDMILENQIFSDEFFRKTSYHIRPEYFKDAADKAISKIIVDFAERYSRRPSLDALAVEASRLRDINQQTHDSIKKKLESFSKRERNPPDQEWLLDTAERWCREAAVDNAITTAILEQEITSKPRKKIDLVDLFMKATAISFDSSIGHDFFRDAESQYDFYTNIEHRISFHLPVLNKITKGGITKKTLTVFMSNKTGGFKSGTMCDFSSQWFLAGLNVLYITLEMSENRIRERIDANIIGIDIDDLRGVTKEWYLDQIKRVKEKSPGRVIVKEYPTGSAHVGHFRALINDLEQKENFVPDIVVLDYLNICASRAQGENSYTKVKGITEEFRGLCVEKNFAGVSATQSGRQGVKMGDNIDLDDVSESYGLPVTVDLMLAIIDNEELSKKGLLMFKQLKNRYDDVNKLLTFVLGVNKARMTLFENASVTQANSTFVPPSAKKEIGRTREAFNNFEEDQPKRTNFDEWNMELKELD